MAYDREMDEETNFFEEDPAYNDTYFGERLDGSDDSAMEADEGDELAAEEAKPEETPAPASADETFGESIAPTETTEEDSATADDMLIDEMSTDEPEEPDHTV